MPYRFAVPRVAMAALVLGACANAPRPPTAKTVPDREVVAITLPAPSAPPPELKTIKDRTTDPVAVVFVVDRSGSMSGEPMQSAKDATLAGVGELDGTDWVAVIGFDSQPLVFVAAQPVSQIDVEAALANVSAGGGTDIFPALAVAYDALKGVDLTHKQVILLTDGQAPSSGIGDLVTAMRADGIVVSTVGLGASYDPTLLAMIAEVGGGRFREVPDATALEDVMRTEVAAFVQSTAK